VKVIDPPDVPEKHSFPHRSWVILGGILLFLIFGIAWIFGSEQWRGIDSQDPGKSFLIEIASSLKTFLPSTTTNGNGAVHPTQPQPDEIKSEH
jgi:hypothetical protein